MNHIPQTNITLSVNYASIRKEGREKRREREGGERRRRKERKREGRGGWEGEERKGEKMSWR